MDQSIERTISCYAKSDGSLVGEVSLSGIELSELQSLFGLTEDEPMYDAYPVGPREAAALQEWIGPRIELDRFDYFVECHVSGPSPIPARFEQPGERESTATG